MLAQKITAAVFGCTLIAAMASAEPRHPRTGINAREHRQAAGIRDGVRDGDLTRAERDRLIADEAAIRAEERVYRRTGDGLNRRERRDLQRDLNKTSREIYRAKHNDK